MYKDISQPVPIFHILYKKTKDTKFQKTILSQINYIDGVTIMERGKKALTLFLKIRDHAYLMTGVWFYEVTVLSVDCHHYHVNTF